MVAYPQPFASLAEILHADDARMLELRERASLAAEARDTFLICDLCREQLDRHGPVERGLPAFIYCPSSRMVNLRQRTG